VFGTVLYLRFWATRVGGSASRIHDTTDWHPTDIGQSALDSVSVDRRKIKPIFFWRGVAVVGMSSSDVRAEILLDYRDTA
jgi:hypothetical protein